MRLSLLLIGVAAVLAASSGPGGAASPAAANGPTGIIETFAGGGTRSGEGVSALDAAIVPLHVAVGPNGDVYFSDITCRVRKVSGGTVITVAGTGECGPYNGDNIPATSAVLSRVEGVAVDAEGNVFFVDAFRCSVRRVDAASQIMTTVAGMGQCLLAATSTASLGGPATSTSLSVGAIGLALRGDELLLAEPDMCRVDIVQDGILSLFAGAAQTLSAECAQGDGDGGPATAARLRNPWMLAVDPAGTVYISEWSGGCNVRKVSGGIISTVSNACWPVDNGGATGIAVDSAGTLFIADTRNCNVRAAVGGWTFTLAGNDGMPGGCGFAGDGGPAAFAALDTPYSVALDPTTRDLYIVDFNNTRIRVIHGATAADAGDTDSDGYADVAEAALGTDAASYCATMRADVNSDGGVNIIDLTIVADYFVRPDPPARFPQGPPPFGTTVNITDLSKVARVFLRQASECP